MLDTLLCLSVPALIGAGSIGDNPAMANYEKAAEVVLSHEGAYVNDPDDSGGETNWGISRHSYPNEDIKNLTWERAKEIYRRDWWDAYGYAGFEDQKVAEKVFDLSVNMGATQAHKLLQRALRATGDAVKDDGKLGPATLGASNRAVPAVLLAALRSEAAGYYRVLIALNPVRAKWENGWLLRAYA